MIADLLDCRNMGHQVTLLKGAESAVIVRALEFTEMHILSFSYYPFVEGTIDNLQVINGGGMEN